MSTTLKFAFPTISRLHLERFSLFSRRPDLELEIPGGVFCLAGANGIGKSTFLAAISLGLTGVVPDPERSFKSINEYARDSLAFTKAFFDGRIRELDREAAAIRLEIRIADHIYSLTRGVFEPHELRELTIAHSSPAVAIVFDGVDSTPEERLARFEQQLTIDTGLQNFNQFIFVQHFVLTFDESRHLLFWDQRALEQVLHIAFNTDLNEAVTADKLRRDMERADSRARNFNFQASDVRGRLEIIRETLLGTAQPEETPEDVVEVHRILVETRDQQQALVRDTLQQQGDSDLRIAEASAALTALRENYAQEFQRVLGRASDVEQTPLVSRALSKGECALCGTRGESVRAAVRAKIDAHHCPLCDATLEARRASKQARERLQDIDRKIAATSATLETALKQKQRLANEYDSAVLQLDRAEKSLQDFELQNAGVLATLRGLGQQKTTIGAAIDSLQAEMDTLLEKKRQAYQLRDQCSRELQKIQRKLELSYGEAEVEFVPKFKNLASLFLGIDLDIKLESRASKASPGIAFVLEMRNATRRKDYQLSESQKFFLDIALRMALAEHMSREGSPAPLFIDTPEGSLDIAYESRAGEMFAKFVKDGHSIIMTANINSSELLLKLAGECGRDRMAINRMTSWTELSDVQLKEEPLFHKAYDAIETALGTPA
ncbi:MAG TPA: hypothetical protein VHU83_24055 [Bryobacteraceae bacterium]|jgi:DNA repair exonuclease SbcCD ATPase subunit|nr:hypothetical protein [Bryobacteraceae bacterium]